MDGIQLESKSESGFDGDPLDSVEAILNIDDDVEDKGQEEEVAALTWTDTLQLNLESTAISSVITS